MYCDKCGQEIHGGIELCPRCGQKPPVQTEAPAPQSPEAAAPAGPRRDAWPGDIPPGVRHTRRRGCLTSFIIAIVVLLVAAAAVLLIIPHVSKPNDLGVTSSQEAYNSAVTKLGIEKDLSPAGSASDTSSAGGMHVLYGPPHDVSATLSSEEITSFFNENQPSGAAAQDVQVRVDNDGTIEASGVLDTDYVFGEVLNGQYTKQDAQNKLPMLGLIPDNVNVYFKFGISIQDNQVQDLNLKSVKIMGVTIPQTVIDSNNSFITDILNNYIARECGKAGATIERIGTGNGQLYIRGTLPSSITRTK